LHGSAAPQTRTKAQRRLQQAADVLVQRLLQFALDGNVADPVALAAIRDALDRAGMKPGVEVDVTLKPYQAIFEEMEMGGSRAEFRGETVTELPADHQRELPPADDDLIDVEIVEADEDNWPIPEPQPEPYDSLDEHTAAVFGPTTPPPEAGLMSYEAAVSAAAAMRRSAVQRTAQRALPPGR
jgi:hypothetical protein